MSNRSNRAKCGSTPSHCDVKIRRTCACATSSTSFPASSNGLTVAIASRVRAAASSTVSPGPLCTGTCSPFGNVSTQSPSSDSGSDRRAHILTRTALGTAVIPFRDFGKHLKIAISGQLRRLLGSAQRTGEHAPLRETLGKRLTQPFAGGTSLIAANVSQRNIGAAGVLSGFAPHGLPVTQQHQAARGDCGSGIASQLSFSHVSTLADASCVFIPFRHVSRTYSGMFSDALHWFHE